MKTVRFVTTIVLCILAFAIAAPLITLAAIPGSTLSPEGYILFLLPAFLIFGLLFLLPRVSQTLFNALAAAGVGLVLLDILFFQAGLMPLVLYSIGALGLLFVKRKMSFRLPS